MSILAPVARTLLFAAIAFGIYVAVISLFQKIGIRHGRSDQVLIRPRHHRVARFLAQSPRWQLTLVMSIFSGAVFLGVGAVFRLALN